MEEKKKEILESIEAEEEEKKKIDLVSSSDNDAVSGDDGKGAYFDEKNESPLDQEDMTEEPESSSPDTNLEDANDSENETLTDDEISRDEEDDEPLPQKEDYESELLEIIRGDESRGQKKELIEDYHDNDIAAIVPKLSKKERKRLYTTLGLERTSEVFTYLDDPKTYVDELNLETAASILAEMDSDEAVDILEELDVEKSKIIMRLMDQEAKRDIGLILSYDDDEIGSHMTTNFISLRKGMSIRQAMKSMVDQAAENDNISTLYVLNDDDTFYGAVDLKDLIIARANVDLESLITTSYPYVYDQEHIEDVIEDLKDYSEDSIPVLSRDMKILGVITSQDVIEVVDEEMGEDYARLAGLSAEEDLKEPLTESLKKRLPWLVMLMLLQLVTVSVTGVFENVIAAVPIMVTFATAILGMAGNVGTQALAVTIRVLMDENLTWKDEAKYIWKELKVGICNGLIIAGIALVIFSVYICLIKGQPFGTAVIMAGCFALAMWAAMIISSMVGALVPILFSKLNIDPAVASGPLITTVNDVVATVTYYSLVWILLIRIMGMG